VSRAVYSPGTLAEVFDRLRDEPDSRIMAGGTDLLVRLRRSPDDERPLVCLERVAELAEITQDDGWLRLGAAASLARVAGHPLVARAAPVLAKAIGELGSPLIRNMGTLGGNVATASPAGDSLPPLYVHEALVELASARGRRRLPVSGFILGPARTALEPGEIIAAVLIPRAEPFDVPHFEKVGRRNALAIAVLSLAALVRLNPKGRVAEARLAVGSAAPTVVRCPRAEKALIGEKLTLASLRRAAALVREDVAPIDDVRATADYRRQVAGNLLLRLAAL
jgi:CO/xanthine dehydrogenase FAD-binding subunit